MVRRKQEIASNDGRDYGWYVEVGGHVVAALVDWRSVDAERDSYRLETLTDDAAALVELYGAALWQAPGRVVFRNRWLGKTAPRAAACPKAATELRKTGRLVVRGLRLPARSVAWRRLRGWLGELRLPLLAGEPN